MNSKILAFTAVLAASAAFAAYDDTTYVFSTKGVDRYADGTQVADGERYALVWSAGEFAGFQADGSLVNEADSVLGVFALAKGGRCPLASFGVPSSVVSKGGSISLWLLDTRVFAADGKVSFAAADGNAVSAIAGAAKVAADISVSAPVMKDIEGGEDSVAASATALPADAPRAQIKDIRVDGNNVYLTVGNTAPYITYDLAAGSEPGKLEAGAAKNAVTGGDEDIIIIAPKQGNTGFIKVIRK